MNTFVKKHKKKIVNIAIIFIFLFSIFTWRKYDRIIQELTTLQHRFIALNHNPEHLTLQIKNKHFKKIDALRKNALKINEYSDAKKYFKAQILSNKDSFDVKVRLKGDQYDHYNTKRFSLRIAPQKKEKNWNATSIQHPKVRNFINEWILHKLLKENNLPNLKYEFKTISINENGAQTYAFEQFFSDPEVFKNWEGIPGPILGFQDNSFWSNYPTDILTKQYDTEQYKAAKIKIYNANNRSIKKDVFLQASQLLKAYQQGEIDADSLFDLKKMGKFYALMDLLGGKHALRWINVRYYYNPSSKYFEPIGYDSNNGSASQVIIKETYLNEALHNSILTDKEFQTAYYTELNKIVNRSFLDTFFKKNETAIKRNLKTIYLSDPNYIFNKNPYYSNQNIIANHLKDRLKPIDL